MNKNFSTTITKKYPDTSKKGISGEKFLYDILINQQYKVNSYIEDYQKQCDGIDYGISKPTWSREFYLDCKNNLYCNKDYLAFKIELLKSDRPGWFFTSKSDRIYHVNTWNKSYIMYDLNKFKTVIISILLNGDISFKQYYSVIKYNNDILGYINVPYKDLKNIKEFSYFKV